MVKIWVDDTRPKPQNFDIHTRSVKATIDAIQKLENEGLTINLIDLDHDAGDYWNDGGDFIKVLDWLEETNRNYPIAIHTANPAGRQNMLNICRKNNWKVINTWFK